MGLLDISGFFTGLIINLLLITLVCYYFKRKYENIESAQMEQAKVLYELLKKSNNEVTSPELDQVNHEETQEVNIYEDSDESSIESVEDNETLEDVNELIVEKIINVNDDTDYNKMSVKSLRDLLTDKGIKTTNKMKKNELISLATNKKSLIVDIAFEENVLQDNNVELENNVELDNVESLDINE